MGGFGNGEINLWWSASAVLYVAIRVGIANRSPITDCDEVYNYWEPVHFLLYGTGLQTWEYAPHYALRTYAYIQPMALLAHFYEYVLKHVVPPSAVLYLTRILSPEVLRISVGSDAVVLHQNVKPLLFHILRSTVALTTALSELAFHRAILESISPTLALWTALSSLTSAGMFHAGSAFLPSSTVMNLWMLSAAAQLRGNDTTSILWGLVAVLAVGWPFCAVLFVSTGLWAVWNAATSAKHGVTAQTGSFVSSHLGISFQIKPVIRLLARTALHALAVQFLVTAIDVVHYGRVLSPTFNIFMYNTKVSGDELYGVEPLSYYVKNLLLNFNILAPLGIIAFPVLALKRCMGARGGRQMWKKLLLLVPMYIWTAIVFPRPHKEERFLFPIYPMLCFGAAVTVDEALDIGRFLLLRLKQATPSTKDTGRANIRAAQILGVVLLSPAFFVSISRSAALSSNYTAPLSLYRHLYMHVTSGLESNNAKTASDTDDRHSTQVCTGGEWHRFPSSFHLPSGAQLAFLKSSFGGQLPQQFTAYGSKEASISEQSGRFNDENKEEKDRYVNIEDCRFVVELVPSDVVEKEDWGQKQSPECLRYMHSDPGSWRRVAKYPYLDSGKTPALDRILYIPWSRQNNRVSHQGYSLYERVD